MRPKPAYVTMETIGQWLGFKVTGYRN